MNKNYPFAEIQEKLASGQKILVVLPANPRYDAVAGALALSLSLQQSGKTVSVVCPTPMVVEFHNLVGVDKTSQKVSGTDLIVSLNYLLDNVEKISYNDDGGKLNLIIQPKTGAPSINEKSAAFSFAGSGADLIFTVGIKNANQLNTVGLNTVSPESIVNIDNRPDNTNFALINVIDADSSSISEIIFGLLTGMSLSLDADIAQNLLNGVWQITQGLKKPDVGADAYELVAGCLRIGAQKPMETPVFRPPESEKQRPPKTLPATPPSDWFEPKIFRGSSNV